MTRDAVLKILKDYYDANRERYGIARLTPDTDPESQSDNPNT